MPIEQFIIDKHEIESYKQLKVLTIDKSLKSYTAFCKSFMIFVNEKEVNISKSNMLKAFHQVNSVKSFLDMGLPIKKYTTPGNISSTDISKINKEENINVAFEIDLTHPKRVQRALNLKSMDCYPLLWCYQDLSSVKWNVQFDQRVACKYIVVKLIDRHDNYNNPETNIDMFPL
jgi:hypothetical protein